MLLQDLLKHLEDISKLGSPGWTTLESARNALTQAKNLLSPTTGNDGASGTTSSLLCEDADLAAAAAHRRIHATHAGLMMCACENESSELDIRVECGSFATSVLQEVLHQLLQTSEGSSQVVPSPEECQSARRVPPPPPDLLSVHQTKVVEDAARVIIYTVVLGCAGSETSRYLKTTLAKNKFVLGPNLVTVPQSRCLMLLIPTMKVLLPVMKHESLGMRMRRNLFLDLLTVLLELCFAPGVVKSQQEHVIYFRQQLEELMSTTHTGTILSHLLFLMGFVSSGSWLGRACGALVVRRFLTQPGGVAAVVGAGLSICEGQDWRCCEAIAAVIAYARTNDLTHYYSTVGPQLCELIQQDGLKPEVMRVVVLTIAELAHRSADLTAHYVTSVLLLPLCQTTHPDAVDMCRGSNLTVCLSRVYKVFVEIPPPSLALTGLLKPVLRPLMMAAALPTTYLRYTARHVIIRYLSQLPKEDAVDALIIMSSLTSSPESPAVHPDITFSVDDSGGIAVHERTDLHNSRVLEDDENLSKCVVCILEQLKNSCVVVSFYEKLTEHIDFTVFNKKKTPHTLLLTDDDIRLGNFEKMRRIVISCSLLENLSESEMVTGDLFVNLSAALPVVDSLIRTGCQPCEEEQVQQIQTSLIMNTLMLISCYISERTLRKKMSSGDWTGLKALLPAVEEVVKSSHDEAVLVLVDQLKNLVLTHGAVTVEPGTVLEAKKLRESASSLYKRKGLTSDGILCDSKPGNIQCEVKTSDVDNSEEVKKEFDTTVEMASNENKTSESPVKAQSKFNCRKSGKSDQVKKEQDIQQDTKYEEDRENSNKSESSYQEAMEDLFNPLLPIRGHALLALGKLLERRDKETMAHSKQLFSIFQHNLKEDDSYLYLMAVEGLAVLCDVFPDKVVEILTREFSLGERSGEDRAKLAEVLVRATRRLGPLLPHYRNLFVNSLLNGMRAQEGMVRAASLSALGDVCKLLKFSLGPVVHEIFCMLHDVVKNDDVPEVRGSAVLVVTLLLQGLGQDTFTVLQEVIRDLYRLLRLIHATDPDATVRLHAQVAIDEVDAATRRFLMPRLSLTKRIYVTEMPRTTL